MREHRITEHLYGDAEPSYRLRLSDSHAGIFSGRALPTEAAPEQTKLAVGLLGLIGIGAMAAAIAGASAFNNCATQPVAFRLGESASAEMTVAKGSRCSLRVETGAARIDDLVVESRARSGEVFPRGRTGVIYQPVAHFTGEDSFSFALQARTARGWSKMIIRVGVVVK